MRANFETAGKFGMPLIKKQDIDVEKIELWGYKKVKAGDEKNKHKTIHFFTYDWHFDAVFDKPEAALEKLDQYYALCTPDFSLYRGMPRAMQIANTFKSRWCGAFWQKQGMRVIPTVSACGPESWDFCFDGIEEGSVVAVSTYGRENAEREWMQSYNKMLEVIKPSAIICYGDPFPGMKGNIKAISPFDRKELIEKLGLEEYARRFAEKKLYPSN
ncbi:MAG: DUF4417 domain-containing protein [Firmicutes bacterium]|nr:DUF4417 domain-containing protein [Bacillota bacterium]